MKRVASILGSLAVLGLAALPAAAAATPGPSGDQGLTGASNMVNTHALSGMNNAMTRNVNGNGDAGMFCAVFITTGVTDPGTCSAASGG
jgi:hypothetical protein